MHRREKRLIYRCRDMPVCRTRPGGDVLAAALERGTGTTTLSVSNLHVGSAPACSVAAQDYTVFMLDLCFRSSEHTIAIIKLHQRKFRTLPGILS